MSNTLQNTTLRGSTVITGSLRVPDESIPNTAIPAGADIEDSKLRHRYVFVHSQEDGSAVADAEQLLHIERATGSVIAIEAVIETAAAGDAEVEIDLEKGNAGSAFASILTSPITITNSTAVRTVVTGTVDTQALADNDVLKLTVDATAGGGTLPQGLLVVVTIMERAA